MENPSFSVGQSFKDVDSFRMALRQNATRNVFDIKFLKNSKNRMIVRCANERCMFHIHASHLRNEDSLIVKKFNNTHMNVGISTKRVVI